MLPGGAILEDLVLVRVTPVSLLPRVRPDPGLVSLDLKARVSPFCAWASIGLPVPPLLVRADSLTGSQSSALLEDTPLSSMVEGLVVAGATLDCLEAGLGSFDLK